MARLVSSAFILCALLGVLSCQALPPPTAREAARPEGPAGTAKPEDSGQKAEAKFEFDMTLGTGQKIDPYGPTPHEVVAEMIALAEVRKDDVVYDLGSGDGRIPIAAAKQAGARGVGIELRPELVKQSLKTAAEAGVADRVRFLEQDFFKVDFSDATAVLLYLYPRTLLELRPLLLEKLNPGTRIVAYNYGMEGWPRDKEQPVKHLSHGKLFMWIVPANVSGIWECSLVREGRRRWWGARQATTFTLHLEQTFQQVRGKARIGRREAPLEDVKIKGDTLSLTLKLSREEPLALVGKVAADSIQGTAGVAKNGAASAEGITWQAKRVPGTKVSIDPGLPPLPPREAEGGPPDSEQDPAPDNPEE